MIGPARGTYRVQPEPAGRANQRGFANGRDRAERPIAEGKRELCWTRLFCHAFRDNAVRLQLFALAYNPVTFPGSPARRNEVEQWSLTMWREKLAKIGARNVRHGWYFVFRPPASPCRRRCSPQSCANRLLPRSALCCGPTGANPGASGSEWTASRHELAIPVRSPQADARSGLPLLTPAVCAPPGGLPIDERPIEEHCRIYQRRLSGRCQSTLCQSILSAKSKRS